jgi:hypothetical protein
MGNEEEQLQKGYTYIIDESSTELSLTLFESCLKAGRAGLCITGEPPQHLAHRHSFKEAVEVVWITDATHSGALRPAMLDQINARRERFLEKHSRSVFLIDAFNLLSISNDLNNILRFFTLIRDDTAGRDSISLVSIDSKAVPEMRYRQVRRLAQKIFVEHTKHHEADLSNPPPK